MKIKLVADDTQQEPILRLKTQQVSDDELLILAVDEQGNRISCILTLHVKDGKVCYDVPVLVSSHLEGVLHLGAGGKLMSADEVARRVAER